MRINHDDALETQALAIAHPVYDCVYLALPERTDRTFGTADARFQSTLAATPLAARVVALEKAAGAV